MQWAKLSVCYYPTNIILVDDKKIFLDELWSGLDKTLICKIFSKPKKFLDYIEAEYKPDPFINRCLSYDEDSHLNHFLSDVDIQAIHQEIYNVNRFNQISVLVIDYAMPNFNGLECCEKIQEHSIYKVLLTGEADTDVGVEGFNQGIIDKFISKSNPDLTVIINQSIHELQRKYFLDLSQKLYGVMPGRVTQCLNDPAFAAFFQKLCEKEHIVEYYLTDSYGSFLLLDVQGNPSWLVVRSASGMEDLLDLAEVDEAPASIVEVIRNKQKIPYFHTEQDFKAPPSEWGKLLHPASHLKGQTDYYYAYITHANEGIDRSRIISYQQYMDSYFNKDADAK